MSNGSSRWSRYLNDDNRDTAPAECDDECVSASAYCENQTASTTDRFYRQEAAPKYVWFELFLLGMAKLLMNYVISR